MTAQGQWEPIVEVSDAPMADIDTEKLIPNFFRRETRWPRIDAQVEFCSLQQEHREICITVAETSFPQKANRETT